MLAVTRDEGSASENPRNLFLCFNLFHTWGVVANAAIKTFVGNFFSDPKNGQKRLYMKCIWIKARSCRWRSSVSHRAVDAQSPDNAAAADTSLPFILLLVFWFACLASGCKSNHFCGAQFCRKTIHRTRDRLPWTLFYIYKQPSSLLHFWKPHSAAVLSLHIPCISLTLHPLYTFLGFLLISTKLRILSVV